MTRRIYPIVTDQIYHIFNRGIASQPIFFEKNNYYRFLDLINYYRFYSPNLRYSFYNRLSIEQKTNYYSQMKLNKPLQVEIYAYCLMQNHYHFLVKEIIQNGITKFIGNIQNGYAKYINTKQERTGSLFQEMFKAVRIENDEQFIHVARYIHLNPATSYLIKKINYLSQYNWSSYPIYLNFKNNLFINKKILLSFYKNTAKLKKFTEDQADYQRKLKTMQNLTFDLRKSKILIIKNREV